MVLPNSNQALTILGMQTGMTGTEWTAGHSRTELETCFQILTKKEPEE
jgi:hypothetical protein